jgi:hypothetical protein
MLHPRSAILMIALGSLIVIAGIAMYFYEIVGATGMILIGVAVELYGGISFLKKLRKNKKK